MSWNQAWRLCGAGGLICSVLLIAGRLSADDGPALRNMKYTSRPPAQAAAWQQEVRGKLWPLLKLDDRLAERAAVALNPVQLSAEKKNGYELQEVEINSTPARRIRVLVTQPERAVAPRPAVVCIHGHSGNRRIVYETKSLYRGFATALAERGYVTISADGG